MRRSLVAMVVVITIAVAAFIWWPKSSDGIVPAGPNPFVESLLISPITVDHDAPRPGITLPNGLTIEDTDRIAVVQYADGPPVFADTIEIPVDHGQYVQLELECFELFPNTIDGREVAPSDRWPLSLAIYRSGDDPDSAREFRCMVPDGAIELPPRGEGHLHPPPRLVHVGSPELRTEYGFAGIPDIKPADEGCHRYWTFIFPPDEGKPEGEYVYEVRLYPTARWVSAIRSEAGDPIVLRRGRLIAIDAEGASQETERE